MVRTLSYAMWGSKGATVYYTRAVINLGCRQGCRGIVAGQGTVFKLVVGNSCNTQIANEICKHTSCAAWELSR